MDAVGIDEDAVLATKMLRRLGRRDFGKLSPER